MKKWDKRTGTSRKQLCLIFLSDRWCGGGDDLRRGGSGRYRRGNGIDGHSQGEVGIEDCCVFASVAKLTQLFEGCVGSF